MSQIVMGLDISTKTGAVVLNEDGALFEEREISSKATGWQRASDIASEVQGLLSQYQPGLIVLEGYGFANKHSLVTLVEIGSVIRYILWHDDRPVVEVAPNALKKFCTGKGTGTKDQIMMRVLSRWGHEAKTNNTADAYVLARIGLGLISGPKTNYEQEVLKKLEVPALCAF